MTESGKYYIFIKENVTEVHKPEESSGHGLMIYFDSNAIDEFTELVGYSYWDDGYGYGVTCLCPDGSICVEDFDNWLDMRGIDWKDIIKD